MADPARRCRTCILPETSLFPLGDGGSCSLCAKASGGLHHVGLAPESPDPKLLEDRVERVRRLGRGRRFDCVVGLSGGRDSTYLLHTLVTRHRLRCAAAYYRTPFTSDETDANVRRLCDLLSVPLIPIALSAERHRRVAQGVARLWLARPHDRTLVHMMCAPCKLVNRELFRITAANGIRTLVCGANPYEAVQVAASVADDDALPGRATLGFAHQLRQTATLVQRGATVLATSAPLARYLRLGLQASVMYLHPHTPYLRLRYPNVETMEYFYYAQWTQDDCETALREVGWQLPPGCNGTWKSDCSFAEVKNVAFRRATGTTYMEGFLSNMVRAGVLSRADALRRVAVEGAVSERRLEDACAVLGVSADEVLGAHGNRAARHNAA